MSEENDFIEKAESYYRSGMFLASAEAYGMALAKAPILERAFLALPVVLLLLDMKSSVSVWACRLMRVFRDQYKCQIQAASLLIKVRRHADSKLALERAICLSPSFVEPYTLYSEVLLSLDSLEGSEGLIERSMILNPHNFRAKYLMATLLSREERFRESLSLLGDLKKIKPDSPELYSLSAKIHLIGYKNPVRGIHDFKKSIILSPSNEEYFLSLASSLFLCFRFREAWKAHEKRLFVYYGFLRGRAGGRYLHDERWFTGDQSVDRVIVWADEGVGDEIKYGSMLGEFRDRVGRLSVQLDRRLIPLFSRSLPNDVEFFGRDDVVAQNQYDRHIAIGSLGLYQRSDRDSFLVRGSKYLWADPSRVEAMRNWVSKRPDERIVGISWRSSNPDTGRERTLDLRQLIERLHNSGVRFVNLQYGEVDADIEAVNRELGIRVWSCPALDVTEDLDGLAALIEACDEVVSIGNTTAHLAGALGKKTTVILRRFPDWRWLEESGQSLWYQSAQVITWSDGVLYD